jgi:hypothetical protein
MIARCLLSLSSFVVSCLCLRMSIAGNKVPPVPDDIGSMGGTNSTGNIFGRDPLPGPPPLGAGERLKGGLEYPYAAPKFMRKAALGRGAHELAPVRPLAKVPKAPFKALCLWPLPLAIPGVTFSILGPSRVVHETRP